MKRVACYVRVSHEEQVKHGISIDAQKTALEDYSRANDYTIVKMYTDEGISARKSYKKRPALLEMIADCQAGLIDLILICKLDRFFRSVSDYYAVMDQIGNIPWKAIHEDYETETANGIFKVNIMLSVAQSEADRTSERIKKTFEYKRSKNEYIGGNKAPIGYKRNGKQLEMNEAEYKPIRAFFDTYLSTLSQQKAIEAMNNEGIKINSSIAQRILYHPAYYGGLNYCTYKYITAEDHEIILKAKKTTKNYSTGYQYIFSGLLVCGVCGKKMVANRTARKTKKGEIHSSIRYVCKAHELHYGCSGSSISEKYLESFMLSQISEELEKYNLKVTFESKNSNHENVIKNNKSRLQRLKDLYELGDIEFNEYKSKRTALLDEIEKLKREPTKQLRQLPLKWLDVYNELDVNHKRAFWSRLVDHIEINGMCCKSPKIFF